MLNKLSRESALISSCGTRRITCKNYPSALAYSLRCASLTVGSIASRGRSNLALIFATVMAQIWAIDNAAFSDAFDLDVCHL